MSSARLDWNGDKLLKQMQNVVKASVDEVIHAAADDARASHWWLNRTGRLEANIVEGNLKWTPTRLRASKARLIKNPETGNFDTVLGQFGTTQKQGFYGLFLEYKTPFLRPAADRHFPMLAATIRAKLVIKMIRDESR